MTRVYAGKTTEERVDARRRRLLDAGLEVFGTDGLASATVRGVCDEAALSTRLFYETFDSLDDLARAVYSELVDATFAAVAAAVLAAGTSREQQSHAGLSAMFAYLADDPRRARVVLRESPAHPALAPLREATMQRLERTIETLGRATYADMSSSSVQVTATLVAGGVVELVVGWIDGRIDGELSDVVRRASALVVAIGDAAAAIDHAEA